MQFLYVDNQLINLAHVERIALFHMPPFSSPGSTTEVCALDMGDNNNWQLFHGSSAACKFYVLILSRYLGWQKVVECDRVRVEAENPEDDNAEYKHILDAESPPGDAGDDSRS